MKSDQNRSGGDEKKGRMEEKGKRKYVRKKKCEVVSLVKTIQGAGAVGRFSYVLNPDFFLESGQNLSPKALASGLR